jgi:hypothetical protein
VPKFDGQLCNFYDCDLAGQVFATFEKDIDMTGLIQRTVATTRLIMSPDSAKPATAEFASEHHRQSNQE